MLAYERALAVEQRVDELLGSFPSSSSSSGRGANANAKRERERTGSVFSTGRAASVRSSVGVSPEKGRLSVFSMVSVEVSPAVSRMTAFSAKQDDDAEWVGDEDTLPVLPAIGVAEDDVVVVETARVRAAREVVRLVEEEMVWDTWSSIPEVKEALNQARALVEEAVKEDAVEEGGAETQSAEEPGEQEEGFQEEDRSLKKENSWTAFRAEWGFASRIPSSSQYGKPDPGESSNATSQKAGEEKWIDTFHHGIHLLHSIPPSPCSCLHSPGHVLTRVLCKTTHALSILKDHHSELALLSALLSQRVFRRGRRGRWHDRLASLLMTHYPKTPETYERAWEGVRGALDDEDTHVVFRPKLVRRLATIEKALRKFGIEKVDAETETEVVKQLVVGKIFVEGVRVHDVEEPTEQEQTVAVGATSNKRRKVSKEDPRQTKLTLAFAPVVRPQAAAGTDKPVELKVCRSPRLRARTRVDELVVKVPQKPQTGKSVWLGRDDEHVTVEIFALQHYESQGYKGYAHLFLPVTRLIN